VIITSQPYDYLRVRVQNKSTLAWTEILDVANNLQIERGGTVEILGLSSVNTGTLEMVLYNSLDPAVTSTLSPKMVIQVYSTSAATPDDGSIFVGRIADISSVYMMNDVTKQIDTYVQIFATDAVQDHSNVIVPGVVTAAGYQRWEERIATLAPYALTTINVPAINTNTVVDSF
jgi:hypothetical protein